MASTPAPTSPSPAPAAPPLRQLWQVPTFLLGLAAFAAVCLARPPWPAAPQGPAGRDLDELRELLQRPDFDKGRALALGAAAQRADAAHAGEAHFLLGTVYAALAERPGEPNVHDFWRQARDHLEQAQALGVPEEDRARLAYRLGKAWAQTGEPPQKVIEALAGSTEAGANDDVDAVRGYGLLAEAYLKLPKPDLEAALAATRMQLGKPVVSDGLLGPARLRCGDLLLRLGRAAEAREVLRNMGAATPPAVVAQARRLLVSSLEGEEVWEEAAKVWREILDDRQSPPQDRGTALYHLGLCLRGSNQPAEALRAWEECLRQDGGGDEGPAAALGAAELYLRDRQVGPALAAFERAVRDLKGPGAWHNSLVTEPRAREAFEAGCRAARDAGELEAAVRLAGLYERVAPPGRARDIRAEAADRAARAAADKARTAPGGEAKKLQAEAEALWRQAGEAAEQAVAAQPDEKERAERWWLAGNCYFRGREAERAAAALENFLGIATRPEFGDDERFGARLNEAYYDLALARRDAGKPGVQAAFEQAANRLKWPSRYVYRARYELALLKRVTDDKTRAEVWTDDAKADLEKNLKQLHEAGSDRDDEAREKTLYALGDVYFQRREQRDVVTLAIKTLEEALRDFKDNRDAPLARYELAESYRLLAKQTSRTLGNQDLTKEARLSIEMKVADDRDKALANYQELARQLEEKPAAERDEELLVYALFAAADCRWWSGKYEEAGEMYEALAERFKGTKQYYVALGNVVWAYSMLDGRQAKVKKAIDEVRAGLPRMDAPMRQQFQDWLSQPWLKALEQPAPPK